MKKSLLFSILIPLAVVTLSGCVKYNGRNKDGSPKDPTTTTTTPTTSEPTTTTTDTSSTEPIPPAPTGQINVYFVLGPNGSYTGMAPNPTAAAAKYLAANTVVTTIDRGSTLPGKDVIKSSVEGSSFLHWVDRETTNVVTTAPDAAEAVLVAVFEGGSGGNTPTPGGLPSEGYGFLFKTAPDAEPYYKVAQSVGKWTDGDGNEYDQYKIDNFQLVKDQVFSLYDFKTQAKWVINLDGWSCGGSSASDTKWQEYLSKGDTTYTVLKTFNAIDIYIKLRYEHDILYMGAK